MNKKIILLIFFIAIIALTHSNVVEAFAQTSDHIGPNTPPLVLGIWHGLLAPYSLIARGFVSNIIMYTNPSSNWFYDFGFLSGAIVSVPVGWIAAAISTIYHIIIANS